jgi:hypothetical protein
LGNSSAPGNYLGSLSGPGFPRGFAHVPGAVVEFGGQLCCLWRLWPSLPPHVLLGPFFPSSLFSMVVRFSHGGLCSKREFLRGRRRKSPASQSLGPKLTPCSTGHSSHRASCHSGALSPHSDGKRVGAFVAIFICHNP